MALALGWFMALSAPWAMAQPVPSDDASSSASTWAQLASDGKGGDAAALRAPARHPKDPFEPWNRKVHAFNDTLDEAVLKPVANAYRKTVPEVARQGIGNFLGNFGDAWSTVNHFLQGKVQSGLEMMMRVSVNTVFGLGGLLDIGSEMGLDRRDEDFGQTLGRWGVPAGPYLVWPLLGPSSLRETAAMPLDRGVGPGLVINDGGVVGGLTALQIVDTRARLLSASRLLDDIALDKYVFVRDAYLTRRRNLVYDGDPPDEPQDKDGPRSDAPPLNTLALGAEAPSPAPADKPLADPTSRSCTMDSSGACSVAAPGWAVPASPTTKPSAPASNVGARGLGVTFTPRPVVEASDAGGP